MRTIELLCPAKNADIGIEAIRHGADAVYIGGPSFGARAAAGNSIEDIQRLCDYAHIFGARVYVTLNVILYDNELAEVENMVHSLYAAGVDALITQDLALLKMDLPPIALHASTQMDTVSPDKAKFLEQCGYSQIVVGRELSIDQLRNISETVTVPIEAFVHGALCVSYSGRCYVSQHICGRSANRGACSQFCRLKFDLVDADGNVISTQHHLSLRDMNRTNSIEQMLDAGVSSFKVEGRLKDVGYVRNISAHYREQIDRVISRRPEFQRASFGKSRYTFKPQVEKSFNRGFTEFFLQGRLPDIWSKRTPKAIGAPVGNVKRMGRRSFIVESSVEFTNGDGLCFFDNEGKLQGFRVNRAEGRELFPLKMPEGLLPGMELFRNEDRAFEKTMEKSSSERVLTVRLYLRKQDNDAEGFTLSAITESGASVSLNFTTELQEARSPQRDNIIRQLSKLGGTPFVAEDVQVDVEGEYFIPASLLNEWRRTLVEHLIRACRAKHTRDLRRPISENISLKGVPLDYTSNVSNHLAEQFLKEHGAQSVEPAFEVKPLPDATLMTCKHCIRYANGQCPRETKRPPTWKEPLALRMSDRRTFPLTFDCAKCEMSVHTNR